MKNQHSYKILIMCLKKMDIAGVPTKSEHDMNDLKMYYKPEK